MDVGYLGKKDGSGKKGKERKGKESTGKHGGGGAAPPICGVCGKTGHSSQQCWKRQGPAKGAPLVAVLVDLRVPRVARRAGTPTQPRTATRT